MPHHSVRETSSPSAETATLVHEIMSHLPSEDLDDAEARAAVLCERLARRGVDATVVRGSVQGEEHAWVELQGQNAYRWTADVAPPFRKEPLLSTTRPSRYSAPSTLASM